MDWDEYEKYKSDMARMPTHTETKPKKINGTSALGRLRNASLNNKIEILEERIKKERDVIPGMITTGTVSLIYAPSGAGKTVWVLGQLFDSIRKNLILGSDILYFNEDDGAKGMLQKAKLGNQYDITMITLANSDDPALRTTGDALRLLDLIREENEAAGKIIICDTLKKFAPVLNKSELRDVLHVFRQFASAGGTVILLGHCNKHRTMDGRLIYEGTQDLKADVDNMFGFDPLNDKFSPWQELLVINEKDRSQVSFEGGFKFKQTSELVGYEESVDSVQFMGPEDINDLAEKQKAQINIGKVKARYEDEFFFLKSIMKGKGAFSQSQLNQFLRDDDLNPNECTKKTLRNAMDLLKGNYLRLERRGANNAKFYTWDIK